MPLPITKGAASAQGFGEFSKQGSALYIEDVFSTYLYTGNGSTQTITNGIDLAGKGGLTWIKSRSAATDHKLTDTTRGATKALISDTTAAQTTDANGLTAFNTTGFSIGTDSVYNTNAATYASWTFRKAAKFFDVVTYTGTGSARTIAHNLGSTPGCIIVKRTDTTGDWQVYHNSLTSAAYSIQLNLTNAQASATTVWNSTAPTSSVFSVGTDATVNASGGTYVAYVFAHNAGGFGLTGTDNVISCGSFSVNGSGNATVNLDWEPQWVMIKTYEATANWAVFDNMRGMPVGNTNVARLFPNTNAAEGNSIDFNVSPTATGFTAKATGYTGSANDGFIYIAIRRGPMKVPTDGTTVFNINTAVGTNPSYVSGFVTDMGFNRNKRFTSIFFNQSRLAGGAYLNTTSTAAEVSETSRTWDYMTGMLSSQSANTDAVGWMFSRAPSFFDVVCYTGTGSATTQTHNLGAVPEMMIVKERSAANDWWVYDSTDGNTKYSVLNSTAIPVASSTAWNNTTPTSSVFSIGTATNVNASAQTYVAYLFASCPGVSKVGSYTGNGSTQTINCGFTGGARFVLIKRTDAAGDWYVYDTARGMTTLTDPYLLLNSTAAETATLGSVTTVTTGFAVNAAIGPAINDNAANYIYFSVA